MTTTVPLPIGVVSTARWASPRDRAAQAHGDARLRTVLTTDGPGLLPLLASASKTNRSETNACDWHHSVVQTLPPDHPSCSRPLSTSSIQLAHPRAPPSLGVGPIHGPQSLDALGIAPTTPCVHLRDYVRSSRATPPLQRLRTVESLPVVKPPPLLGAARRSAPLPEYRSSSPAASAMGAITLLCRPAPTRRRPPRSCSEAPTGQGGTGHRSIAHSPPACRRTATIPRRGSALDDPELTFPAYHSAIWRRRATREACRRAVDLPPLRRDHPPGGDDDTRRRSESSAVSKQVPDLVAGFSPSASRYRSGRRIAHTLDRIARTSG